MCIVVPYPASYVNPYKTWITTKPFINFKTVWIHNVGLKYEIKVKKEPSSSSKASWIYSLIYRCLLIAEHDSIDGKRTKFLGFHIHNSVSYNVSISNGNTKIATLW